MTGPASPVRGLKGRFPFRLGTTSYIIPADILPNVEYLAPLVDDVALILFESEEISNLPDPATVAAIAAATAPHDLSFTVHLPLDAELAHPDEATRRDGVAKCLRVLEVVAPLHPTAFAVHVAGERRGRMPSDDLPAWQRRAARSLDDLIAAGLAPDQLCVETLDYPYELIASVVLDRGASVCLDVGHLLMQGYSLRSHFDRYLPRTRIIHLHGIASSRDHAAIDNLPRDLLVDLLRRAAASPVPPTVTLEIFNEEDFRRSMAVMGEVVRQ